MPRLSSFKDSIILGHARTDTLQAGLLAECHDARARLAKYGARLAEVRTRRKAMNAAMAADAAEGAGAQVCGWKSVCRHAALAFFCQPGCGTGH